MQGLLSKLELVVEGFAGSGNLVGLGSAEAGGEL